MVSRKVNLRVDKAKARPGEAVLGVADLVVEDPFGVERVKGVGFAVRRGEIVGPIPPAPARRMRAPFMNGTG